MFEHFEAEKAKKKALSTAEKKELKKQKDVFEEKYITCLLDGRKEKVGNFRVEPPGLFRGRGDHPKKGALKVGHTPHCIYMKLIYCARHVSSACAQKTSLSISVKVCLFLYPTCLEIGRALCTTKLSPGLPIGSRMSTAITNMSS
jgi:hypothetical protein